MAARSFSHQSLPRLPFRFLLILAGAWLAGQAPISPLRGQAPDAPPAKDSLANYATDDFFAAGRLRIAELADEPLFGWLALSLESAPPVSLQRLAAAGVAELAVFAGAGQGAAGPAGAEPSMEWAVAARFSQPIELAEVFEQWRRSTVYGRFSSSLEPEHLRIAGRSCVRLPAGTLLQAPRVLGELRFLNNQGEESRGVNVGRIEESRAYVEGGTAAAAVFTFDRLGKEHLIDGRLPLELQGVVFRTYQLSSEFSRCRLALRNPATGLRSEPIEFEAKSYVPRSIDFPRELTAVDSAGKQRQADLLQDLISQGKLEVVLQGNDERVYYGFRRRDLGLRVVAHEYVTVAGRDLVVAQSPATLEKMLRGSAAPIELANRLARRAGEGAIVVNVRDQAERRALKALATHWGAHPAARLFGEEAVSLDVDVNQDDGLAVRAAVALGGQGGVFALRSQAERGLRALKTLADKPIDEFVKGDDTSGWMLSLVFQGAPMMFPRSELPPEEARRALHAALDELFARVTFASRGAVLEVSVKQPARLSNPAPLERLAWGWGEERLAKWLFEMDHYDLGDAMYGRAADRLLEHPEIWFRRAHHLAYNMSVRFDGYESRYRWVRRGIESLLDGADRNPNNGDFLWMAGRIIGDKIGSSDEREQYRQLFAADRSLHRRLAAFIAMENARSPVGDGVDNWRTAKLLFQNCVDRQGGAGGALRIPPILVHSGPALAQARYAQTLDEAATWGAAAEAWREAEELFQALGARSFTLGDAGDYKLDELSERMLELGAEHATVQRIQLERKRILYGYWRARCAFERTEAARAARRMAHEAEQLETQSELEESLRLYQRALRSVEQQRARQPAVDQRVADSFRMIAKGYRRVATKLEREDDSSIQPALKWIEESKPPLRFPLVELARPTK